MLKTIPLCSLCLCALLMSVDPIFLLWHQEREQVRHLGRGDLLLNPSGMSEKFGRSQLHVCDRSTVSPWPSGRGAGDCGGRLGLR